MLPIFALPVLVNTLTQGILIHHPDFLMRKGVCRTLAQVKLC